MPERSIAQGQVEAGGRVPPRRDLRDWLRAVEEMGELRRLEGADWDVEIGAVTEMCMRRPEVGPALLFDRIRGYPRGFRVLTNSLNSARRLALTLHMDAPRDRLEFVRRVKEELESRSCLPPKVVASGPVLENALSGRDIDLWKFPSPKWHELDGGRYLGTGCVAVMRDPEEGWLNLGTYRAMVQDRDSLTLYISPGKQGRIIRDKYFSRGEVCPVAVSFGHDPLFLCAGGTEIPRGVSEYDWIGGIRGAPLEVIEGEYTGLPFPAHAEIVVEGELDPAERGEEGPFGAWTGYYAGGVRLEPLLRVKRLYHRHRPILLGAPPGRPPCEFNYMRCFLRSALIWRELEGAGLTDIRGVWCHEAGGGRLWSVVSVKQRYAGHSRQAAMMAAYCQAGAYLGRYCIVVDEDVDPTDTREVLWALSTRSDPQKDLQIVGRSWSGPLDPVLAPGGSSRFSSRAIIDACRPYDWKEQFPPIVRSSPEVRREVWARWARRLELQ